MTWPGSCQKAIAFTYEGNVLATRIQKVAQVPFSSTSNKSKLCLKYSCLDITRPPPSCASLVLDEVTLGCRKFLVWKVSGSTLEVNVILRG